MSSGLQQSSLPPQELKKNKPLERAGHTISFPTCDEKLNVLHNEIGRFLPPPFPVVGAPFFQPLTSVCVTIFLATYLNLKMGYDHFLSIIYVLFVLNPKYACNTAAVST
jgi:hypothetical protein